MDIDFIRAFDGDNITGSRFVICCKVTGDIELGRVINIANDYIVICRKLGYKENIVEIQCKEGYTLYVSYTNKYIQLNIIEAIVRGENKLGIIRKGMAWKKFGWKDEIQRLLIKDKIPFIDRDKNTLQIGYCSRMLIIDENDYRGEFNSNVENLKKYINENNIGEVPIVTVTGTNGKTTTTRIIYSILVKLGYRVGMAATGGIFIGEEKIKSGDTTGYFSARRLLENKDIDIVVLETARGGILKRGLAFTNSTISIITSLTEDHIGQNGVKSLDDLAKIKLLTVDALKSNGKIISPLNNHISKYLDKRSCCLFSLKKDDKLTKHIENGEEAIYLRDNNIVYCFRNKEVKLINIKKIPFCHYGISKSNVKNIMAALVALKYIHKDMSEILKEIECLNCDIETNKGRQNIIKIKDFTLIIDYGHNSEAFYEVYNIAKELKPSKVTSIIGAAGDRPDKYIKELGYISSKYCDEIIIREHVDLREREKGETPKLLEKGALTGNITKDNIHVIEREEDAIQFALTRAVKDEVIVYYTQWFDIAINQINKYLVENQISSIVVK